MQILREIMYGVLQQLQQHEYATAPAAAQNALPEPIHNHLGMMPNPMSMPPPSNPGPSSGHYIP